MLSFFQIYFNKNMLTIMILSKRVYILSCYDYTLMFDPNSMNSNSFHQKLKASKLSMNFVGSFVHMLDGFNYVKALYVRHGFI